MEIQRYFIEFAYRGTHYHGWQFQKNAHSVQAEMEKALSVILKQPSFLTGSGRTDTGVHASQQYAHFDTALNLEEADFVKRINGVLPKDIAVYALLKVKNDAHARFNARWRSYLYRITLRKDPFEEESAWLVYHLPSMEKMNEAAKLLLNHKDFQCFSKVHTDVNHFNCEIKEAYWEQKDHQLLFHITANRFLRGMVRTIVGTLVQVGLGRLDCDQFQEILDSKSRSQAKSASPAHGLYLCKIVYPQEIFI
ncbi:tRNA pseudouridine(38-40) synthase TruA [Aquiflexum sp. TKW24L]|uniref:tRNA pseudouridine(38-40) synthase TruA n=1 Tax=Aquiflexum sp. TKW24L TaxID=2942212 RepID=UPI0020BEBD96|nr:tRNA pseudouridine(38-40) synthase TruA [Aquiflexum sp. TKW24L]MCL6261208.1 tRNA pseudouridine(38-40) synthase TruA [Aquiflexum sp. TKW24L]